jgi:CheY-like chemotaxis protein
MRSGKPDLILLDIVMPRLGGIEVLEEMQKEPDLKKIPVIVISNSGQPVELDKAQRLGAKDWLVKTEFDPAEVIEKVKKNLGE